MSQVIVTKDQLEDKRRHTGEEEKRIDVEASLKKWQQAGIPLGAVEKAIGIAAIPLGLFWAGVCAAISLSLSFALMIFKGLSMLWPKAKPKA